MKKSTKKALLVVGGLGIVGTAVYFLFIRPKSLPTSTVSKGIAQGGAAGGASGQPT